MSNTQPRVEMSEDGSKLGVILIEDDSDLLFVNYVLYRHNPYREYVGLRYADSSKNLTCSRMVGGNVDIQDRGGKTTKGEDPFNDALMNEIKKRLNVEALIKEFISTNRPHGWPIDWPSKKEQI